MKAHCKLMSSSREKTDRRPNVEIAEKTYSRFGIGLPLIYTPVVIASNALSSFGSRQIIDNLLILAIPVFFGILDFLFLWLVAKEIGASNHTAIIVAFISSVFTLSFRYTVHDHSEIMQACFFMGALPLLLKQKIAF
jgi:FtsH-binding integral membrane protein